MNSALVRHAAVLLAAGLAACARPGVSANRGGAGDVPVVTVDYSNLLDMACSQRANITLDTALVAHLLRALPMYEEQWSASGPALLREEAAVIGRPFGFHEVRAAIITCGVPSMSFPVILNAGSFRRAPTEADEASVFVNTLWHEISHRQIDEIIRRLPGARTPLLVKYAAEPPVVLNHLHLYAVQELVYGRLNRMAEVQAAIAVEQQLRNRVIFDRAHQIVAVEGAEAFVRELRPR
jgi:hypothetical protein